jgi:hypothetical protein
MTDYEIALQLQQVRNVLAQIEERLTKGGCCGQQSPASSNVRKFQLSESVFLVKRDQRIPEMDARGIRHEAYVTWMEDSAGRRLTDYTCTCDSGSCHQSKACATGVNINCDCVACTMSCS